MQVDIRTGALTVRKDRRRLREASIVNRFEWWAHLGNSHAMWWLAWWNEGINHPKSIWFYVAAIRAAPESHSWAWERIKANAKTPCLCPGVLEPTLDFLEEIPEIQGNPRESRDDWKLAVYKAFSAVHVPVAYSKSMQSTSDFNSRACAPKA